MTQHADVVVCGDFNVAPTDADVFNPAAFVGSTHVTPSRAQPRWTLCGRSACTTSCRTPMKGPNPFTYWDYRAGMFHQDKGMRIDLVYATRTVAGRVKQRRRRPGGPQGQGPL